MKIRYICYYNYHQGKIERENVQSASTKIDYIIDVLNRSGIEVDIISKSPVSSKKFNPSLGEVLQLSKGKTLRHFFSLGCRDIRLIYIVSRAINTIHFFFWLLFNTHKGEQLIVYHSLGYTMTLSLLKKIKGLRYIGEIEEIYQDVQRQYALTSSSEYKFIDMCDKYIFPTHLLDEKLNVSHKPFVVIHGVYKSEQILEQKFDDGLIHVVYGGTLNPQKGGAAAAAAAAEFLPKNYHVHICGFGDSTKIREIVHEVSSKSEAKLTFEGELKGESYKRFIQKCHIGLSTQNPDSAFNATSFPSKILVYLANGLQVVTIDIPAVALSSVRDALTFYQIQAPQQIASAIIKQQENCAYKNSTALLIELDKRFAEEISALITT